MSLTNGMKSACLILPMFLLNHALHKSQGSGHMLRGGDHVCAWSHRNPAQSIVGAARIRHKHYGWRWDPAQTTLVKSGSGTNNTCEAMIRQKRKLWSRDPAQTACDQPESGTKRFLEHDSCLQMLFWIFKNLNWTWHFGPARSIPDPLVFMPQLVWQILWLWFLNHVGLQGYGTKETGQWRWPAITGKKAEKCKRTRSSFRCKSSTPCGLLWEMVAKCYFQTWWPRPIPDLCAEQ